MHGMILYSVATRLWVSFFDAGLDYWSIVVAAFIPYILITFISAWFFYYLFDKTSISAGHSIYRWLFVEEWTLENLRAGLGRYAQGWRDWAAERREEVQVLREKVRPNFSSSLP